MKYIHPLPTFPSISFREKIVRDWTHNMWPVPNHGLTWVLHADVHNTSNDAVRIQGLICIWNMDEYLLTYI